MRRSLSLLLLLLLLSGCAMTQGPTPTAPPADQPSTTETSTASSTAPPSTTPSANTPPAAAAPTPALPPAPEPVPPRPPAPPMLPPGGPLTPVSPDGKWLATLMDGLWISAADGTGARQWEQTFIHSAWALWSPWNTFLYYRDGQSVWFEADPATGEKRLFLPEILAVRGAGHLRFSEDGSRLLFETGVCFWGNRPGICPGPQTTWEVRPDGTGLRQVGVDLNPPELKTYPSEPAAIDYWWYRQRDGEDFVVERPARFTTAAYHVLALEWRFFTPDGDEPLAVIPGLNKGGWFSAVWPEAPEGRFRVEIWGEAAPDEWLLLHTEMARLTTELPAAPVPQAPLAQIQMETASAGWGVDLMGRLLRTQTGGDDWTDVTPQGLAAMAGKANTTRLESLQDGGIATVALAHHTVTDERRWSPQSGALTVWHTANAGITWNQAIIDTGFELAAPLAIHFVDAEVGFLVAGAGGPTVGSRARLFRTTDGGRTWTLASALPAATREIKFKDATTGWLLSSSSWEPQPLLYVTHDGGQTWAPEVLPLDGAPGLPDFLSPTEGYLTIAKYSDSLPEMVTFRTLDGGHTWKQAWSQRSYYRPIHLDSQVAWVADTEHGQIEWTQDGGATWSTAPWREATVVHVQFVTPNEGWGLLQGGWLKHTADGGRTWSHVRSGLTP